MFPLICIQTVNWTFCHNSSQHMNLYTNNIYFEILKNVQKLNTYMYIVWVSLSALYRAYVQRDIHRIISTFKNNRRARCLADRQRMLYAPLQLVSLVPQLVCWFVNSEIVLSHACCISYDNTILVLKSCVSVTDYFQAFLATCMVGCAAALLA